MASRYGGWHQISGIHYVIDLGMKQHWWNTDWTEAQLEILWILKQVLGELSSLRVYMK